MKNIVPLIIVFLIAFAACGKKEGGKKDGPGKTPEAAPAKVTVASLAELVARDQTAEFVKQLENLTAIQVNDPADTTGRTLAMLAAGKGNLEALRALVAKAARLDAQDRQGRTALHHGAGFVPVVTFLLEKKVDPDRADADGRTPVHAALALGRCDVMGLLLAAGANRDARDRAGTTPLHLAAAVTDPACLNGLIERKASVNAADAAGFTPLLAAAQAGNLPALELLLKAGGSLSRKTKKGDTAVHLAAGAKTLDALRFLVEKKKQWTDARNQAGQTALHLAAAAGAVDAAVYLMANKAYVDGKDKEGRTPLHVAASRGQLAMVKALLEKKAFIDAADFRKRIPLHLAIMAGKSEVAGHLVAAGASTKATDQEGFAALHHAIIQGDESLATQIIEKSGKVEVPTKDGWTPLHLAAFRGREKMVRLLLDRGADVKAKDRKGNHAFHLALDDLPSLFPGELEAMKKELGEMTTPDGAGALAVDPEPLKAAIAWLEEETKSAESLRQGRRACARLLIERGSELAAVDASGRCGLQIAAASGMKDLFDLLREKGLKGDKPDYRKRTLLYHAAIGGDLELVKAVMEMGPTELAFKYNRETPLHLAVQHNRVEVARHLVSKGADPNAKAYNGDSAILYAAKSLATEVAAALFEAGADPVVAKQEDKDGPAAAAVGARRPSDDGEDWRPPVGEYDGEPGEEEEEEEKEGEKPRPGLAPEFTAAGPADLSRALQTDKMDGTALDVVFRMTVKNTAGRKGRTPRSTILLRRQLRFLDLLYEKGTPVRASLEEKPVILEAIDAGHRELVELMMKRDPKFKEELGKGLLGFAVLCGHHGIVRYMMDQGVMPDKAAANRILVKAILKDDAIEDRVAALDVFTRLLPTVEDLDAPDESGDTLLHHAVGTGSLDFVRAMLEKKPSLVKVNKEQETPLHVAVRNGRLKIVELILTTDPNVPEGERPLVPLAAASGSVEVLRWLLKHGYKDVETSGGKISGLFAAARAGSWSTFDLLSSGRSAALKAVDEQGSTIAHHAAQGGSEKILKALQKAGIVFTVANTAGETPLHLAVRAKQEGTIRWLLKNGADPTAVDGAGKKAVDYADEALKALFEGGE